MKSVAFEVFLPGARKVDAGRTVKVEAETWVGALKAALVKQGGRGATVTDLSVEVGEDGSILATDAASGRVFRVSALDPSDMATIPPKVRKKPAPDEDPPTLRLRKRPRHAPASMTPDDPLARVRAAWAEAEAVVAGKRGRFPFNREGKSRLLEALEVSRHEVRALVAGGVLDASEARLLQNELAVLAAGVGRTSEELQVECYRPAPFDPVRPAVQRLLDRLPLLESAAAARTLNAEVVRRLLASAEQDVAVVCADNVQKLAVLNLVPLAQQEKARAALLRQRVLRAIARVRSRLGEAGRGRP